MNDAVWLILGQGQRHASSKYGRVAFPTLVNTLAREVLDEDGKGAYQKASIKQSVTL